MTDLAARLQRRAAGGAAAMLPYLPERPADPRFGPASPLAVFGHEPGDDLLVGDDMPPGSPLDGTTLGPPLDVAPAGPPSRPDVTPPSPASEEPARGSAVALERRSERVLEREREPAAAPAVTVAPVAPGHVTVAKDMAEKTIDREPVVTATTRVERRIERVAPPATPPRPAVEPPVSSDIHETPAAPPRDVRRTVAPPPAPEPRRESTVAPRLAGEPRSPAQQQQPPAPRPAPQPAPLAARLEPRPRDPRPHLDVAPEPPRVVIGNLHIEVVRAPAPAKPRREPSRREPQRAAGQAVATPTRARRRTVFGLGQL